MTLAASCRASGVGVGQRERERGRERERELSLIHISEPTRPDLISYAVFCLKKKNFFNDTATTEIYTR